MHILSSPPSTRRLRSTSRVPQQLDALWLQMVEWRVQRAGSLKICSSQLDFAKSLLDGGGRNRSLQMQSLRKAARSVSDLLHAG